MPRETKARLLEWKIRMDLLQYAARGVPALSFERLATYQPRKPGHGGSLAGTSGTRTTYLLTYLYPHCLVESTALTWLLLLLLLLGG